MLNNSRDKDMTTLYILECEGGKWYIGDTNNLPNTLLQHFTGQGPLWTRQYPPLRLVEQRIVAGPHVTDNVTKRWMLVRGISNVRGGKYSRFQFSAEQLLELLKQVYYKIDVCSACGQQGGITVNHLCHTVTPYSWETLCSS